MAGLIVVGTRLLPADLAADLGDAAALAAVDRFAEANFSRITNKSGFLMVCLHAPSVPFYTSSKVVAKNDLVCMAEEAG